MLLTLKRLYTPLRWGRYTVKLCSSFSLKKPLLIFLIASLGSAFSAGTNASEPTPEELKDLFAFRGLVYQQEDSNGEGGNPTIDESAVIYEGILLFQNNINSKNASTLKFTGDLVTAASYDDARDRAETVSGATGYNPGRWDLELGWKHLSDNRFGLRAHASYGQEYAYRSQGFGFGLSKSFAEEATQISASVQLYDDQVRLIRYDGSKERDQTRDTFNYEIGLIQTLSPVSLINLAWSHSDQQGFLATSFNSVLVAGERQFEVVPETRRRDALSIQYKHAFDKDSIQAGLSHYQDSWDISANIFEFRYFWRTKSGAYHLQPSYRYYDQQGASFFDFSFEELERYRSSDSDLGNFDGHSFGLLGSIKGPSWFTKKQANYDLGINYYARSDDLDFYWLTLGWRFPL